MGAAEILIPAITRVGHHFRPGGEKCHESAGIMVLQPRPVAKTHHMMHQGNHLLIVGASARAAAFSAVRAGYRVSAIDAFGDVDLRQVAQVTVAGNYPHDLLALAAEIACDGFIYTGAMENRPELIERLSQVHPLWGNNAQTLRRVRDPFLLADALQEAGLPYLPVRRTPPEGETCRWLSKPVRSAGGSRIDRWPDEIPPEDTELRYLQRFQEGRAVAGVLLADGGRCRLLGVTQQIIGAAWCGASGFQYCGSIGPLPLSQQVGAAWRAVGQCLTRKFGLQGVFGVDAVQAAAELLPVEVNPRYPASAELIEQATGASIVGSHIQACQGRLDVLEPRRQGEHTWGKAILFARQPVRVGPRFPTLAAELDPSDHESSDAGLVLADLPSCGTSIPPGQPIATILATGKSEGDVERQLRSAAKRAYTACEACELIPPSTTHLP